MSEKDKRDHAIRVNLDLPSPEFSGDIFWTETSNFFPLVRKSGLSSKSTCLGKLPQSETVLHDKSTLSIWQSLPRQDLHQREDRGDRNRWVPICRSALDFGHIIHRHVRKFVVRVERSAANCSYTVWSGVLDKIRKYRRSILERGFLLWQSMWLKSRTSKELYEGWLLLYSRLPLRPQPIQSLKEMSRNNDFSIDCVLSCVELTLTMCMQKFIRSGL